MTNFDIAEASVQNAINSEGSAMEEHARAMDSIEGKLSQLKATWESFSQTMLSSDFLKGLIDTGTNALSFIDELVQKLGTVPTLLTAISGAMSAFTNTGEPINQFHFSENVNMPVKRLAAR